MVWSHIAIWTIASCTPFLASCILEDNNTLLADGTDDDIGGEGFDGGVRDYCDEGVLKVKD